MEVLAKSQLCIPNTPSTEQGSLQFQVIEGGSLLDISLRVETANGGVVRKKLAFFNKRTDAMNLREGFVEWEVDSLSPHQVYQVCFFPSIPLDLLTRLAYLALPSISYIFFITSSASLYSFL